ncbi:carboxy terminal-processing peptidase [Roseivirga sp. BDSF3-8]|uniref:carboxy terminal-processing peptidase n=1 Tax=Roseivirga sp. BDSF3-8 TaxID=3241598 RepID=UPI003531AEFF
MGKTVLGAISLFAVLSFFATKPEVLDQGPGDTTAILQPKQGYEREAILVSQILTRYHYRDTELNDSLSQVILENLLETLDYNKVYFLEEDVREFNDLYASEIDDMLEDGESDAAYAIFKVFRTRFLDRMDYVYDLLEKDFDFTQEEYYDTDREDIPYASTNDELDEVWRKMVKNQALSLKLSDRTDEELKDNLKQRYERMEKTIRQYNSEDVFQLFLNAFAAALDPHTSYFSPTTSENFKIQMSQSLEGIGASLRMNNDYVEVADVIAGGPAFRSKQINKDDKIIGVGQGEEGEIVDVIGWRLDDVVKLIRGPKGTTVRLEVLPAEEGANGLPFTLTLIRDKVKLEEQAPSKKLITQNVDGKDYKVAVITIPAFYLDYEAARRGDKDYKSTTRDVRKLLSELDQEQVDALLIDLRFNGGGSLSEAIELTGLFIEDGPVVQVKDSQGKVEVMRDPDDQMVYKGPMGVMINRFSASASEIFAGAIQDYHRGIVLGEQTYGKGTVQNLLDLDQYMPYSEDTLGQVKLTIAKFYRVNGSSTQHKGVTPDIEFPSAFSAEEFGESSKPSALPWDQIAGTRYNTTGHINKDLVASLLKNYENRMDSDKYLQELKADIKEIKEARKDTKISLNLETRKAEMEEAEKRREAMADLVGVSIDPELPESEQESITKEEEPYIMEGVITLAELVKLTGGLHDN